MSNYVFPDNTVLCNFGEVGRLDLLETVLRERGRWTQAVALEAAASARHVPPMTALVGCAWLGEPIEITDEHAVYTVDRIRRAAFGGDNSAPLKHLGESETCYIIKNWPEFAGSWWVTDDREALRYARLQGLITRETCDLMAEAVASGDVTAEAGLELLREMERLGRYLRVPATVAELRQ